MPGPAKRLIRNGVLVAADEARLGIEDGLFRHGLGLFDTLAAFHGIPFLADAHIGRLRASAGELGFFCPDNATILSAIESVLAANALDIAEKARVRITLSSPDSGGESWWVEATPPPSRNATARVGTGGFVRNEQDRLTGHKTTSCAGNVLADRAANQAGLDEMLFFNTRGEVCEGTWANVFLLVEQGWITPPLDSGCLPGITRAFVLGLAEKAGIAIRESTLLAEGLKRVRSAFLTSSLRGIQPIVSIDGRKLEMSPGTAMLQAAYHDRLPG